MNNTKVLIVDDEEEICMLLSAFLKPRGYDTNYAISVTEGKQKIKQKQPDIVFLDINLPDGEGFDLVQDIRENPASKIIIISAREGEKEKNLAKKHDIDDYITKPFTRAEIIKSLEKFSQQ